MRAAEMKSNEEMVLSVQMNMYAIKLIEIMLEKLHDKNKHSRIWKGFYLGIWSGFLIYSPHPFTA